MNEKLSQPEPEVELLEAIKCSHVYVHTTAKALIGVGRSHEMLFLSNKKTKLSTVKVFSLWKTGSNCIT